MKTTPEIIITNLKKRHSGVTSTINTLLPVQSKSIHIGYVGTDIPGAEIAETQNPCNFTRLTFFKAIKISIKRLPDGRKRIWHVRRDPEMLLAIFLRDFLRLPIKIVFTSAAIYRHSWFPRWLISKMNAVIATTSEAASFVPNTTKIIPHGVNSEHFYPPKDKHTAWSRTGLPGKYGIGTFGRVRAEKGTDIFVDTMIRLLPNNPEFTAVIAGFCHPNDARFQEDLIDKIRVAGLENRILFLGEVPIDQIVFWYQSLFVVVACPRYEGFGITPIEAMACGCAVVATETGAFKQIVEDQISGFIISKGSIQSLFGALKILTENKALAIQMGVNGRIRQTILFSSAAESHSIEDVYRKLWK
jgi:mannosyltransferase